MLPDRFFNRTNIGGKRQYKKNEMRHFGCLSNTVNANKEKYGIIFGGNKSSNIDFKIGRKIVQSNSSYFYVQRSTNMISWLNAPNEGTT